MSGFLILVSCNRTSPSHYLKNGQAKYQLKNYSGAIQDLNKAISLKDNYSQAYYFRAICYAESGKVESASNDFDKALQLDPNLAEAYLNRAFYVKEKSGDYTGAVADYNKFIALNTSSNNSFAYSNRGYSKYKLNRFSDAIDDIEKSIQLDPENSYAYKNLALVYIALDKLELACSNLSKASSLGYSKQYGDEVEKLFGEYCSN